MNQIYLVYNSEIETERSLSKFKDVMVKAGFELNLIAPIDQDAYEALLETKIPNFAICLNQTYKDINITYSDKLDIPIFEFFSKEFISKEKNILLSGILLNIDDIFKPAYKRYAWTVITNFFKYYTTFVDNLQYIPEQESDDKIDEIFCEYLDDAPVVSPVKEIKTEELVVAKDVMTDVRDVVVSSEPIQSGEDLKIFYFNVKQLISQFNVVQDQLKLIEKKFSDK